MSVNGRRLPSVRDLSGRAQCADRSRTAVAQPRGSGPEPEGCKSQKGTKITNSIRPRQASKRVDVLAGFVALSAIAASASGASASDGVLEINQACAAQTGCFSGDTAGYPVTITSAGSYRLSGNLVVPDANTNGLLVSADDVSIDLVGFEIKGPVVCSGSSLSCTPFNASGAGVAVSALGSVSGLSVRDGSIRGMGIGVQLGEQSEATNLRVRSNRSGGISVIAGSTVSANAIHQNGGGGIFVFGGSTVSRNSVYENGGDGIVDGFGGSTIVGNTTYQNGGEGIEVYRGSTVSGNTSHSNEGIGIRADSGCTVQGNTVRANGGVGLHLGPETGYRENVISENGGGTVSGAVPAGIVNLGNNACDGSATCP